eukprot:1366159-Amphidinium_carterae.1
MSLQDPVVAVLLALCRRGVDLSSLTTRLEPTNLARWIRLVCRVVPLTRYKKTAASATAIMNIMVAMSSTQPDQERKMARWSGTSRT